MRRAGDGGIHGLHDQSAATRDGSASRVTSSERYTRPFTTKGNGEGKSWFYEKNGRRVLHLRDGRYWRAPRPRPRPNRRKRRRESKNIVQAALHAKSAPVHGNAEEAIIVLQRSLQNALSREKNKEAAMKEVTKKLEMTEAKLRKAERQRQETQIAHNELEDATAVKLKKAHRKLEKTQQQHAAELRAREEKLDEAQRKIRKLQDTLRTHSQSKSRKKKTRPTNKTPSAGEGTTEPDAEFSYASAIFQATTEPDAEFDRACFMLSQVALPWQEVCYYSAIIIWKGSSWYHWFIRNVAIIVMIFVAKLVYDNFQGTVIQVIVFAGSCMIFKILQG